MPVWGCHATVLRAMTMYRALGLLAPYGALMGVKGDKATLCDAVNAIAEDSAVLGTDL